MLYQPLTRDNFNKTKKKMLDSHNNGFSNLYLNEIKRTMYVNGTGLIFRSLKYLILNKGSINFIAF